MTHKQHKSWVRMSEKLIPVIALVLAMVCSPAVAIGQPVVVNDVRVGVPGDRWLDLQQFERIKRTSKNTPTGKEFGYAVSYAIAGNEILDFFWPRTLIDFAGKEPRVRMQVTRIEGGRLWYPDKITARSLPSVYHGILRLEAIHLGDARGAITAMEGFAQVALLGAGVPGLAKLPAVSGSGSTIARITSRATGGRVATAPTAAKVAGPKVVATARPAVATTRTAAAAKSTAAATGVAAAKPAVYSSRACGRALEKAGHVRPPGAAAHHIVAGNAKYAEKSRALLQRLGIGINDAANGVFLPATKATVNPTGAAVHSSIHTRIYYESVHALLRRASSRKQAEAILAQIRRKLLTGGL